jgi:GGDEF domain-containing protein
LISIKKASEDLDRLADMVKAVKASYNHAVWSAAQYTIDLDAADSKHFRDHLERIRAQADRSEYPEDWASVQSSFRGELRDHRDRSLVHLNKLRSELRAAAEAMETFANGVAACGADHKQELETAIDSLETASHADNLQTVRAALIKTKDKILTSVEKMEHEHQFVIAQLRDEIRSLHEQIDAERRVPFLDTPSGVWNRTKIDSQMKEMLTRDESFCVLVIRLRNMRRLEKHHTPAIIEGGVKALVQRLAAMLGEDAAVGRWDEEVFAAILQIEPAAVISLSREATIRLSGGYTVQENGMSRRIDLTAATGVLERVRGMTSAAFHQKLQQMADALAGL